MTVGSIFGLLPSGIRNHVVVRLAKRAATKTKWFSTGFKPDIMRRNLRVYRQWVQAVDILKRHEWVI